MSSLFISRSPGWLAWIQHGTAEPLVVGLNPNQHFLSRFVLQHLSRDYHNSIVEVSSQALLCCPNTAAWCFSACCLDCGVGVVAVDSVITAVISQIEHSTLGLLYGCFRRKTRQELLLYATSVSASQPLSPDVLFWSLLGTNPYFVSFLFCFVFVFLGEEGCRWRQTSTVILIC